jgi:low temperature requirement protein LtrA
LGGTAGTHFQSARPNAPGSSTPLAIAHPADEVTVGFAILAFGGPSLFLLAQVFFLRNVFGHASRSRYLRLGALPLLAVATAPLSLIAGIAGSAAVLVGVATADTARGGGQAPSTT